MAKREPLSPTKARKLVLACVRQLSTEAVPLTEARGRVLAVDVISESPIPSFDSSAMDGFAVRAGDTVGATAEHPRRLAVVDESRAGRPASAPLDSGEAVRISTGAMLPKGADAIVRVEDVTETDGSSIDALTEVPPGRDVRRIGDDIAAGECVLARGASIEAAELGVLASLGRSEIICTRGPEVILLSTGSELREVGEELRPGEIFNSNLYTLSAQITAMGGEVLRAETVRDDRLDTVTAISAGLAADLLVICGGVSVGAHDHVKAALSECSVTEVFWRVAQKPGGPLWFGYYDHPTDTEHRTLVFGLPGNPVSAMVCARLYVRPALLSMLGANSDPQIVQAVFDVDYDKRVGRAEFVRCCVEQHSGVLHARPTGHQGSHILTSMLSVGGLAHLEPERGPVNTGEVVDIELLPTFLPN